MLKNGVFIGLFLKMAHLMIMMYNQTCKIGSENHILSSKHFINWIINCLFIELSKFSGPCHTSPLKQLSQEPAFISHWSMFCCASFFLSSYVSDQFWNLTWLKPLYTEDIEMADVNSLEQIKVLPLWQSPRGCCTKDSLVSHLKWSVRPQKKKKKRKGSLYDST